MDICNLNFLRLVLFSMLDGLAFLDSVCTYVFVSECMCVCVHVRVCWLAQDFLIFCAVFEDSLPVTLFGLLKRFLRSRPITLVTGNPVSPSFPLNVMLEKKKTTPDRK